MLNYSSRFFASCFVITMLLLVPVLQSFPLNLPPLLPDASAQGGITLNSVQTTHATSSSSITLSNFNVGTGSNLLLVVGIESDNQGATSVKFGTTSLTQAVVHFTNDDTEFWYLKNPSGTANIVVTMAGTTDAVVGAYALTGVNQTSPIPTTKTNSAASGNPTISMTTQYANSWMLDSPSIFGGSQLSNPTCTSEWNVRVSSSTITGASSNKTVATPGSATCTWTNSVSSNGWDDVAVEIHAATGNTVPGAPTNPTSTAVNTTALTLGWTAPSSNGGSPITGYQIQKASTSWVTVVNNTGNVTSHTIGSLASNSVQTYRIGAWNSIGLGPYSSNDTGYTMPTSPTSLTATAVSSSQINLSWTAPSGNGTTGYKIERSTDGGSTWSTIKSNTGNTNTSYSDTELAASTTYTYRVSTINGGGTSSPSNTASATTSAAPTGIVLNNVQATSGTVALSPFQVTLSNFNVGSGSNLLLVVGIEANNQGATSVKFGTTSLTQAVSHFTNDDTEFWYLKNPSGTANIVVTMGGATSVVVGAYSLSGVNQTSPVPTTHTNSASSGNPTISLTTQYQNSWMLDSPAIFGGSTLSSPTCTKQWDIQVSAVTVTGASSNKTTTSPGSYTCSWTNSISTNGWDDAAVEIHASGSTAPNAPAGLYAVTMSTSRIDISWTTPSNNGGSTITGYKIERSTNGGSTWSTLVSNTGSTNTLYADTGLTSSTTYAYRVSAINSIGTSTPSNAASSTTFSTSSSNWRSSTGILEPLYCDPYGSSSGCYNSTSGFNWISVNNTKNKYPHVPFFAIINPNSGSCAWPNCPDPNYAKGIANLTKSGVIVLGYVDTCYCESGQNQHQKPLSVVKNDINNYTKWYKSDGLKGILLDDFESYSVSVGNVTYWQAITNYTHNNENLTYSFGNPGTDVDQKYQGSVDLLDICESNGNGTGSNNCTVTNSTLQGQNTGVNAPSYWHTLYDKSTYSFLLYNQSSISGLKSVIQGKSVYVSYMYVTDDGGNTDTADGHNPWDQISTYLSTLAGDLNNTSAVSAFQAFDKSSNNALVSIPKILIYQDNNPNYFARNGTVPFAYNETSGWEFNFTAPQNYGPYHFCSWTYGNTNTTNHSILVTPTATMIYNVTYTKNPTC